MTDQPYRTEGAYTPSLTGVDALAQEIRRVDGAHSLGAGALAEALMPFIEAVRAEEREKTLRDYAHNRYLAFLEHPEVPWLDQPGGTARHYAKVAADMIAEADRIRAQGKEQDRG